MLESMGAMSTPLHQLGEDCPHSHGSELLLFPIQIGSYFAPECSTKGGHTGCLGQQEHARWQMPWQESTCSLQLEQTSL